MIKKINLFSGKNEDSFPKVGRVAGSKTEIVEIQKGERQAIRDILGISEDMDIEEMQAMARDTDVWVVCQAQKRTVASLGNQGATIDSEVATDGNGDELTSATGETLYVVPEYAVNVVSHVGVSLQDCIANEPNETDLETFVKTMELRTSDKTSGLAKKMAAQQDDVAAAREKANADRQAANERKLAALKARANSAGRTVVAPAESAEPVVN